MDGNGNMIKNTGIEKCRDNEAVVPPQNTGQDYLDIRPEGSFSFSECLVYLDRAKNESTHFVDGATLYKLVELNSEKVLLKLSSPQESIIRAEFLNLKPDAELRTAAFRYIWEWFDLGRDLEPFYEIAGRDRLLKAAANRHKGLRIVGINDLFEALVWAIAGQQINLAFAYTLKSRLVEKYGESVKHGGRVYRLFPRAETIARLTVGELTELKFTSRKAEYILGVAEKMAGGMLSKDQLLGCSCLEDQREILLAIRGIGSWTADYVIMKCIRNTAAFPTGDAGLQNAIKNMLGMERKPTIPEIENMAKGWRGWEAYATFYLWRTLYE